MYWPVYQKEENFASILLTETALIFVNFPVSFFFLPSLFGVSVAYKKNQKSRLLFASVSRYCKKTQTMQVQWQSDVPTAYSETVEKIPAAWALKKWGSGLQKKIEIKK